MIDLEKAAYSILPDDGAPYLHTHRVSLSLTSAASCEEGFTKSPLRDRRVIERNLLKNLWHYTYGELQEPLHRLRFELNRIVDPFGRPLDEPVVRLTDQLIEKVRCPL